MLVQFGKPWIWLRRLKWHPGFADGLAILRLKLLLVASYSSGMMAGQFISLNLIGQCNFSINLPMFCGKLVVIYVIPIRVPDFRGPMPNAE